jgi:hypothetical protein
MAAAQGVMDAGELPGRVDGYHIKTDSGVEFYVWPDHNHQQRL